MVGHALELFSNKKIPLPEAEGSFLKTACCLALADEHNADKT